MLTDILPGRYRQAAYAVYALVGVVLGAIQVAYLNIAGQPTWLNVAIAVYAFAGTAFGATAGSNITTAHDSADYGPQLDAQSKALAAQHQTLTGLDAALTDLHASLDALPRQASAGARKGTKKAAPKPPAAG